MSNDELDNDWKLGQCVYTMSTGKRCQKEARVAVEYGSIALKGTGKCPTYGYCHDHYFSVTKPRDPRIHRTAKALIKAEQAVAE